MKRDLPSGRQIAPLRLRESERNPSTADRTIPAFSRSTHLVREARLELELDSQALPVWRASCSSPDDSAAASAHGPLQRVVGDHAAHRSPTEAKRRTTDITVSTCAHPGSRKVARRFHCSCNDSVNEIGSKYHTGAIVANASAPRRWDACPVWTHAYALMPARMTPIAARNGDLRLASCFRSTSTPCDQTRGTDDRQQKKHRTQENKINTDVHLSWGHRLKNREGPPSDRNTAKYELCTPRISLEEESQCKH